MSAKNWLVVDEDGLRKNSSLAKAISELAQNGIDTDATLVTIDITPDGKGKGRVIVVDNDPVGFVRLSDAYTLLAPSTKAGDDTKAGVFNVGEKEFLSFAVEGRIDSMSGSVIFDAKGRRAGRTPTSIGSRHDFTLRMTLVEQAEMVARLHEIIVRDAVEIRVNGTPVPHRPVLFETMVSLPLMVADPADPYHFVTRPRMTRVTIHEAGGRGPLLHVLGMPVQPIDLPYSVNVHGRLKLDQARDTAQAKDVAAIRAAVANTLAAADQLSADDATEWAASTIGRHSTAEATRKIMGLQYGDDFLTAGVKPGPNADAVSAGRKLVYTAKLPEETRDAIKRVQAIDPGFAPTPAKAGFGDGLDTGSPGTAVERARWTPDAERLVTWAEAAYRDLTGRPLVVTIYDGGTNGAHGSASDDHLNLYVHNLGWAWFEPGNEQDQMNLTIHEFGHLVAANGVEHTFAWSVACISVAAKLMVRGVMP